MDGRCSHPGCCVGSGIPLVPTGRLPELYAVQCERGVRRDDIDGTRGITRRDRRSDLPTVGIARRPEVWDWPVGANVPGCCARAGIAGGGAADRRSTGHVPRMHWDSPECFRWVPGLSGVPGHRRAGGCRAEWGDHNIVDPSDMAFRPFRAAAFLFPQINLVDAGDVADDGGVAGNIGWRRNSGGNL